MEEKSLTEKESLELIARMINRAKNRFIENGFLYLLWGWVVLLCCLLQFVIVNILSYKKGYYVWFLTWLLIIYQPFTFESKKEKASRPPARKR